MSSQPTKLPRLPRHAKITKRPLLRAPLPSPYASAASHAGSKTVYVTARTPVISAVKRVRGLLALADQRAAQSEQAQSRGRGRQNRLGKGKVLEPEDERKGDRLRGEEAEEVVVKGTGRAIDTALRVAVWFLGHEEFKVVVRTGSVGTVDDVEAGDVGRKRKGKGEKGGNVKEAGRKNKGEDEVMEHISGDEAGQEGQEEEEEEEGEAEDEADELPESRIRFTSMIEVGVSLR
ncbi:MAG: hypothetical protein M1821_005284 [Bathelium mastoideum]|nr:MAG: hypothetical protein M1821_005284 [Bathelium mastoideum]